MSDDSSLPLLPNLSTIGHVVHAKRKNSGLTQQQLADRAGVSRKWISELENGKSSAELRPILDVLQAMGFTLQLAHLPTPDIDLQAHIGRFTISETQ